jgi:tetratricopeptide (TPR) repeat protein
MYADAIAALQRSVSRSRRNPGALAILAGVYGFAGQRAEALKLIDELKATAQHQHVSGFCFAQAYAGLGDSEQALTWLESAYEDRDQFMVFIKTYPGLDPLRSEPRFQTLVRRMNFPQ